VDKSLGGMLPRSKIKSLSLAVSFFGFTIYLNLYVFRPVRSLPVDNVFIVCDLSRDLAPPLPLGWAISRHMFTSETSRPRTLEHDPKPTTASRAPRLAPIHPKTGRTGP